MRMHWLLLAGALVTCGMPAHATLYDFSVGAAGPPSSDYFFTLPADPTPDFAAPDGSYFELDNVTYLQGGESPCPCQGSLLFYTTTLGNQGGVETPDAYFEGPQLFSGTAAHPTFDLGYYNVIFNAVSFYNGAPGSVSITVSAANAVPEPATWAMILAGMAMAGLTMRRRATIRVAYT